MAVFAAALSLYALTLAPGLAWGDASRLQLDAVLGSSTYFLFPELAALPFDGLPFERLGVAAWDHPLYVMFGHLAAMVPLGRPALRISAISALAGALAVVAAWRVMRELSGDSVAAALGALSLAVSHTFWFHAVTAEVYTLHALFMLAVLGLALRSIRQRRIAAPLVFAALVGLGLANHLLLALSVLACVVYMLPGLHPRAEESKPRPGLKKVGAPVSAGRRLKSLPGGLCAVLVFCVAFAPWWVQALRMVRLVGLETTLAAAFATPWLPGRLAVSPGELAHNLLAYCGWLAYQFGPLGVCLGGIGAAALLRLHPRQGALLLSVWLVHVLFSANYAVADRFAFHLPSYIVWALWIAVAAAQLRRRLGRRGGIVLAVVLLIVPPLAYAVAPRALRAAGLDEQRLGIQPIGTGARDALRYYLQPWKQGDESAEHWARGALEALPPAAHVIAAWPVDQEAYLVLRYTQLVELRRGDVRLDLLLDDIQRPPAERVYARAAQLADCAPLFLASLHDDYGIQRVGEAYRIVPQAGLWRLLPRRSGVSVHACAADQRAIDVSTLLEAMRR